MQQSSRLSFGYHLEDRHAGLDDFLNQKSHDWAVFLREVGKRHEADLSLYSGYHPDPPSFFLHKAMRIRMRGSLGSIESAFEEIVQRDGVPDFVDKPQPRSPVYDSMLGSLLYGLFGLAPVFLRLTGQSQSTITTLDAFDMIKGVYGQKGVKTRSLSDNTLVLSSHTYF
jgi:hypothetical protein